VRLGDVSPRSILKLPPEAPVRRLAVQLAAREANAQAEHVCVCGEKYVAIGIPPTFHDGPLPAPQRFLCRKATCRLPL